MERGANSPKELSSWKEIAHYLGVGIRTAQGWERERSLPIRRSPSGRVYALASELDTWRLGNPGPAATEREWSTSGPIWAIGGLLILGTVVGIAHAPRKAPTWFRIMPTAFVAVDDHGTEVWTVPWKTHVSPGSYDNPQFPMVAFGDITGDAVNDVVVAHVPENIALSSTVRAFDHRGRSLWAFEPGRVITAGGKEFERTFGISQIAILRTRRGVKIVVVSHHVPHWAAQVALLNSTGQVEREYWHPGQLVRMLIHDIDGDGRDDLLLGGVNNDEEAATLVVLDPELMGGGPEARPSFAIEGLSPAIEKARVLFRKSTVNVATEKYNVLERMFLQNGKLYVNVEEAPHVGTAGIIYYFDSRLNPIDVRLSDGYVSRHRLLLSQGVLRRPLAASEAAELRKVRYATAPIW